VGFRIEMDDFGTGYSSLNMISTLPIDALKLDMQFIRSAFQERKDTRMLEVILEISNILAVPTIAEGVETAEQMFTLKSMGCNIVQGYYFSKPLPAAEFEKFLLEKRSRIETGADPDSLDTSEFLYVSRKKLRNGVIPDRFTYDALHDPVTGLYNGSAFEVLLKDADHDHIALLIMDVMEYAELKEHCSRNLADRISIHVADILRQNFRSVDYICRLREDEFAVIMTRVISEQRHLIEEKILQVNDQLHIPVADLPPIRVAAGAAFSDRPNPSGDIFQDADSALIHVLNTKNGGCEIY